MFQTSLKAMMLRQSRLPVQRWPFRLRRSFARFYSDAAIVAGEETQETTGEIKKSRQEFVVYYSNMFIPTGKYNRFFPSFLLRRSEDAMEKSIVSKLPPDFVEVKEFIPRDNEGGVFVKYRVIDPNVSVSTASNTVIKEGKGTGFLGLWPYEAFLVRGSPWIEDLQRTFTSSLRVTFDGPDLSPEQIYHEMRRYGRILTIEPPSPASKDVPRSAVVVYKRFFSATTARNCVNRLKVGDTVIHVSFIRKDSQSTIVKWISDHPRISIPILIALVAGLAFYIFEPIRILSISSKASNHKIFQWVNSIYSSASQYVLDSLRFDANNCHNNEDVESGPCMRGQVYEVSEQVIESLKEGSSTFNVVVGPKGSGKEHVVATVVEHLGNTPIIQINCQEFAKAKNDTLLLESLSSQIGYRPAFLWTTSIARFVDLAATSLSGQSSGFSETTEQQFNRMLNTAASAIQKMALKNKPSDEHDNDYLTRHPELRPLIVLKNYRGSEDKQYSKSIAQWAGSLVSSNTARVLIITQEASYEKSLGDVLPDSVLRVNTMTDANTAVAKQYILQLLNAASAHQAEDVDEKSLVNAIKDIETTSEKVLEPLGGRLSDLQNYTRRIMAGETACDALEAMVDGSALEIEQMYLNSSTDKWSSEQAWVLIKKLAALNNCKEWLSVPADIASDPIFSGVAGISVLKQLEYRELLIVNASGGQVHGVRAGKPLFYAAFCRLLNDPYTRTIMDQRVVSYRIKAECTKIKSMEEELINIAKMPTGSAQKRLYYLTEKMQKSQTAIELWEKEASLLAAELKKIVQKKK